MLIKIRQDDKQCVFVPKDNNGRNNGDDVQIDIDADDEEDEDNGSEAPLDEIDRDGIPKEPLKTLLVCNNSVYGKYSQCSVF